MESSSFYLTMRDGVKIAVDLHLPDGLPEGAKIPTILYQTRYIRSLEFRWPFSLFKRGPNKTIARFVSHGYAWVSVDARGSGASYGTRPYPWSPDEVKDGAEIADWIISQPWSDGKVGTFGTSYTGTTSEFLLVNNHPAVKAAAPRFALFDVYTDIAFPGGIHLDWFTDKWAAGNLAIDTNTITDKFGPKVRMMVRGIKPVDQDRDRSLLAGAINEHRANYNVHEQALGVTFRDDIGPSGAGTSDTFSPHSFIDRIKSSGAAVYCVSGWYDGAYQHAAIKRYLTLSNPRKLTIGPWEHGGRQQISPWSGSREPEFDQDAEMLRFFDYHLKGIENGIMEERPVWYFTMGEEKWKSADTWPPPNRQIRKLYFSADNRLANNEPTGDTGHDRYVVDYSAGTGDAARWNSLTGPRGNLLFGYPDRKEEDEKLLCYTSEPLSEDMEVTGHPVVRLHASSTADDGNFFVYLEDVDQAGRVVYVTEGQLRALHRKLSNEQPPYRDVVPYRTFKRKDAMPLVPGEVAELVFDLLPTSYLFKKGHSVRVAIAGADKDHFALMKADPPPALRIYRTRSHASAVELPVARR
ncbi:MAG: CocE/NonD family hydrolase [Candidatus Hydrogenedentota bacterium]|nr:MAG: CocE/NonD family hydrolase [Candidatus Hydrogenedentota bacterium]